MGSPISTYFFNLEGLVTKGFVKKNPWTSEKIGLSFNRKWYAFCFSCGKKLEEKQQFLCLAHEKMKSFIPKAHGFFSSSLKIKGTYYEHVRMVTTSFDRYRLFRNAEEIQKYLHRFHLEKKDFEKLTKAILDIEQTENPEERQLSIKDRNIEQLLNPDLGPHTNLNLLLEARDPYIHVTQRYYRLRKKLYLEIEPLLTSKVPKAAISPEMLRKKLERKPTRNIKEQIHLIDRQIMCIAIENQLQMSGQFLNQVKNLTIQTFAKMRQQLVQAWHAEKFEECLSCWIST